MNPFHISPARNQGRRPPRIAGPSAGTAIWLLLRVTDSWDVLGFHKVPVTEV
jgi:histidinol dehydrogenase